MKSFQWEITEVNGDGPGPRSRHGLVYDRDSKSLVLFGGLNWEANGECQCDTWEMRDRSWNRIGTVSFPPARHRGAMVFDSQRGFCVLFGGQNNGGRLQSDTWIYEGRQWKEKSWWFRNSPAPRCGHMLAFDETLRKSVIFGGIGRGDTTLGDTWTFDGDHWRPVKGAGPPARRYAAFAYHPQLKGCVLHGGAFDDHGAVKFGDTWLFREGEWQNLGTPFQTESRDDHGIGYHEEAETLILLEGLSRSRDIFTLENEGWNLADIKPLHPRHQCSQLAYFPELNGLAMYGGEVGHGGHQFDQLLVLKSVRPKHGVLAKSNTAEDRAAEFRSLSVRE